MSSKKKKKKKSVITYDTIFFLWMRILKNNNISTIWRVSDNILV